MLLEIAIGDAYGAGFEFAPETKVANYNTVTQYLAHELGLAPGHYTDDTQMSIALTELLIEGSQWEPRIIANKFVECFKRDQRKGYSKNFYALLDSISTGQQLLDRINPDSTRNGACMRAAPLGILCDISALKDYAEVQASITHNTEAGIKSAQAVALCSHFYLKKLGSKVELTGFVEQHTNMSWDNQWTKPVACCGVETVNALLTVLTNCSDLKSILIDSVKFCGDVDTVAALALGIAFQSEEYQNNLPAYLYDELENNRYGKLFLADLGKNLLALN